MTGSSALQTGCAQFCDATTTVPRFLHKSDLCRCLYFVLLLRFSLRALVGTLMYSFWQLSTELFSQISRVCDAE
jgi:hypothetical protein